MSGPARRKRPTAFEVSFPEEFGSSSKSLPDPPSNAAPGLSRSRKRRLEADDHSDIEPVPGASNNRKPQPVNTAGPVRYRPDDSADHETFTTIIPGEVIEIDDNDELKKPVRFLDDFHFFDPKDHYALVDLFVVQKNDGGNGVYEGLGKVSAVIEGEDAGQEDDLEDSAILLRLDSILTCTIDYTKRNDSFYIETQYASYRLVRPSKVYHPFYCRFYTIHRAAQIAISSLIEDEYSSIGTLLEERSSIDHDILGRDLEPKDFVNAYSVIRAALENTDHRELLKIPLLRLIAEGNVTELLAHSMANILPRHRRTNLSAKPGINLDREVIQPGNESQTTVTPLVYRLSVGLFGDYPYVLKYKNKVEEKVSANQMQDDRALLVKLLDRFARGPGKVKIDKRNKLERCPQYLREVEVSGDVFKVGDVVVVPMDYLEAKLGDVVSEDKLSGNIADYFWFARILWIDRNSLEAHVQWFEHSSQTCMGEISHPRELFLTLVCDNYPMGEILGKVSVKFIEKDEAFNSNEDLTYFYQLQYVNGVFVDIPTTTAAGHYPPFNCQVCHLINQFDYDSNPQATQGGYAYRGHEYHLYDFIHYIAVDGPCKAGQIIAFESGDRRNPPCVKINLLGNMDEITINRPRDYIKDERHLYFTDEVDKIPVKDIIRKIYIVLPVTVSNLESWKALSPIHFHVRYKFPSSKSRSWAEDFSLVEPKHVPYCDSCFSQNENVITSLDGFFRRADQLRALDVFAGVGAFTLGMGLSCPIKPTHAIEISPSAARTLANNAPGTIVYNQCSNEMLRYAVDVYNKVEEDIPTSIEGKKLSPPPQPGDIDVIVAGFPCQPHSSLNRFQHANDRKSHLILNLLSWVDFLRPRYCFFENVRGFLDYNIGAVQSGNHRTGGGIPMGGLKFVIRCLLAMGYQARFALLQAGHYGLPQTRVRFFLIAAIRGEVLPDFPQPTHDFPVPDALKIKLSNGRDIQPINTLRGIAPCHFVTIDDAIGDLPLFDWKGTKRIPVPGQELGAVERTGEIPVLNCNRSKGRCGFEGEVAYRSEPMTTYQVWCRKKKTKDLQQITRTLKEDTVNRVVHIPLRPKADYRDLPKKLWEWQISNPASSVAKGGFKPGIYGRLDKDQFFNTTVTNVEPTAKQSWVLHPECKRVLTVRELARSQGFPDEFVFCSINNDVKTMHRQIGNAVPWQLSRAIGRELGVVLWKQWKDKSDTAPDPASVHGYPNTPLGELEYITISDSE